MNDSASSTKPIRVAFVITSLGLSGAELQLTHIVKHLDRSRFEPIVVTLRERWHLEEHIEAAGIQVVPVVRRGRWDLSPLWRLRSLFRERRTEVVVTFLSPAILFGLVAARWAGVPLRIASERGTAYSVASRWHRLYTWLETRALRSAALVVANSEAGREFVVSRGIPRERTEVILNGLRDMAPPSLSPEAVRSKIGAGEDDLIVGTVAAFWPRKDHETLVRAAASVLKSCPKARFVLIGEGPQRQHIEALVASLGIGERVELPGRYHEITSWLGAMTLAVLPSLDREGCSNFLMEAQASGLPAVATLVGGNAEVVADKVTGILVPARDPDAMAAAIIELLNSPHRLRFMGKAAKKRALEVFDAGQMVSRWESVLATPSR